MIDHQSRWTARHSPRRWRSWRQACPSGLRSKASNSI